MEIIIILLLILLNGFLSMSEIALVSARKSRLSAAAKRGNKKARRALDLAERPEKFLPAVQIGITLVGIFLGVYSGESIANDLEQSIARVTILAPYANGISIAAVVIIVTYLSLVLGELVPKRIGLAMPETIAKTMAGAIHVFALIVKPFIWLLELSTRFFIFAFRIKKTDENKVTEEEIKAIVEEGTKTGEVREVEKDIVDRVFILGDTEVKALCTHRNDIQWLDIEDNRHEIRAKVAEHLHNIYPVANKNLDEILGIVRLKDLFLKMDEKNFKLRNCLLEPHYLPETTSAYDAIRIFRTRKVFYALVVDEYGNTQGMLTVNDILESLVGEVSPSEEEYQITRRDDGSFLVDGQYPFHEFLNYFDMEELYEEHHYNTISGLILEYSGSIPQTGFKVGWMAFDFEVVDMDGPRIDKLLVTRRGQKN
jgi:putative hemolysin